ncbi:ABC transporter ATP-binding protein (plasmid) [Entomospira entomophila]|uniref:ABC transporter ATP-binding protein n=1 Tax=Entomospira entomophila TaxID=2719988 RepID=A0A968KS44_9SPIO|nr:ABC transporter ATP-binding protein [Entomospira entomophilus]NIZ41428.1 ABC transporter ATP-binding protein [Entomospira entomophilus]WDI36378.1 ABC transporter ATP-binding protein [Entomospira entomophilus]
MMLSVSQLHKTYGQGEAATYALRGIDLTFNEEEFTVLSGPSGCGKSTLLNCLGTLDSYDQGDITFYDKSFNAMNSKDQTNFRHDHLGFIFQNYNLIPVLTVYENIALAVTLKKWSKQVIHDEIMTLLQAVGLEDKVDKRPTQLSGGQQQRVAIARALVKKPALILADEPTANLDAKTSQEILDLMIKLNQERKSTFIFSTHDPMVSAVAKRIIHMKDGVVTSIEERS